MDSGPRPDNAESFLPNSTEYSEPDPEKKNKASKKIRVAIAGAALALMMATGVGCSAKATEQPSPPTTEAPAAPGQTQQTSPEATPTLEKNPSAYASEMEQYKEMDVATFESLPRNERLVYAQYILDSSIFNGDYRARYGAKSKHPELGVTPVAVSLENTGQEILDSSQYNLQLTFAQYGEGAVGSFGVANARKALSAIYYNVGDNNPTNDYLQNVELQATLDGPVIIHNITTATTTSELLNGVDAINQAVQYKTVGFNTQDGETRYGRYVYDEFIDYKGAKKAVWLLDAQTASVDELKGFGSVK